MRKACTLFFTLFIAVVAMAQTSVVKVKITDEQNLSLPGASVILEDKKFNAVSGSDGVATLYNVPAGRHTVTISYIGYKEYSSNFTTSGTVTELSAKIESGIVSLNNVLVLGDRLKGQAKALNQQKNSDNVTNIISADQIGRFPDANIGDAIKRVPGITMQNDQGEARNIVVRGMGPGV